MPASAQIGTSSTAIVAVVATVVGFAAFWSNPQRAVNRGFFAGSLVVAAWLICLSQVLSGGVHSSYWAAATAVTGAATFVPIWFIKEAIVNDNETSLSIILRARWWILACAFLAVIRTSYWYMGAVNLSLWVFVAGLAAMYGVLCRQTVLEMRHHQGLKRLELQIALLGSCATGLVMMLLLVVRWTANWPWVMQLSPIIVLMFYTGTVVAMTTSRVFNARQLLIFGLQKVILITLVAAVAYGGTVAFTEIIGGPMAWLVTAAIALWLAAILNERLNGWFQFYPQGKAVRQAALSAAQRERRLESLEIAFKSVLTGWGHAERAVILSGNNNSLAGGGIVLDGEGEVMRAMRQLTWATPERLARERATPDRIALLKFLQDAELAIAVFEEGFSLSVLTGVGASASRRPYTYPQVTQLMELGSIMASALERAHFSVKVQHTEQLATVGLLGASLAHEIRNPLVSIKTFVQLLPTHHHDAAFRDKFFKLIGDEVTRIDQLTEQLMDLASPRAYMAQTIELHPVLAATLELAAAKASHKNIQFLTEFQANPDRAFTDASAAKQVLLNLCFNAIQAVDSHNAQAAERWVKITTRNIDSGIEMAVADSGPGIDPEMRPNLFQPFHTTKSTGFGLGLVICSDILSHLNASISVDPPCPEGGATFRVIFPCQPLSS